MISTHSQRKLLAYFVSLVPDHTWNKESINEGPNESNEDEVGENLENRSSWPAKIEAMPTNKPKKEPQEVGNSCTRSIVRDPLLDEGKFGST